MTTQLHKAVKRKTNETRRDRGKQRHYIVTLYPSDMIGVRLEGTRKEETLPISAVYEMAVRARVSREKAEKAKARKAKREFSDTRKRGVKLNLSRLLIGGL